MNLEKSKQIVDNVDAVDKKTATNASDKDETSENHDPIQTNLDAKTKNGPVVVKSSSNLLLEGTPGDSFVPTSPVTNRSKNSFSSPSMELSTSTISVPATKPSSSSTTIIATRSSQPTYSDNGSQKQGLDLFSGRSKEQSINQTVSNGGNRRNNSSHQTTNGSLSESLTSNDGIRTPNVENLSKTNLYIRGLPNTTTDDDLYNMCIKFGQIFSTKAILDKTTGCCKGKSQDEGNIYSITLNMYND